MKILFVCTGNTCRSPMAKIIFEDMTKKNNDILCDSAGLFCVDGLSISKNANEVLKEINLNGENHKSKNILQLLKRCEFDKFIVMTKDQAEVLKNLQISGKKIYVLGNGISDPYGLGIDEYRKTRDQIKTALEKFYAEIINNEKTN